MGVEIGVLSGECGLTIYRRPESLLVGVTNTLGKGNLLFRSFSIVKSVDDQIEVLWSSYVWTKKKMYQYLLLSRPSIEMNTIWELKIKKVTFKKRKKKRYKYEDR